VDELLDELTISPAINCGPVAVVVTVADGVFADVLFTAFEPELLEQPMMAAPRIRKILRVMKILAEFFIHYHYSTGY